MIMALLMAATIGGNSGWAASPAKPVPARQAEQQQPVPAPEPEPELDIDFDEEVYDAEEDTTDEAVSPPSQPSDGRRFDGQWYYLTDQSGQQWQATDWPALWDHVQRRNAGPVTSPAPGPAQPECRTLYDPLTGRFIQSCPNQ